MNDTPNPGSDKAIEQGCRCAILDNNHGKYPVYVDPETGEEAWWITASCHLHGMPSLEKRGEEEVR